MTDMLNQEELPGEFYYKCRACITWFKITFYSSKAIEDPKLKIGPHLTLTSYYYPHNIRISATATAKQVPTLAVAPHLCHAFQPIPLPFSRYPPRSTITRFTLENTYHGWQCTRVKACCIAPRISVIGYNKIPHIIYLGRQCPTFFFLSLFHAKLVFIWSCSSP